MTPELEKLKTMIMAYVEKHAQEMGINEPVKMLDGFFTHYLIENPRHDVASIVLSKDRAKDGMPEKLHTVPLIVLYGESGRIYSYSYNVLIDRIKAEYDHK